MIASTKLAGVSKEDSNDKKKDKIVSNKSKLN
jgi:hypothetical protein